MVEEEVEGADLAEAVLVEMECGDREASAVLLLLSDVQGNYFKNNPRAPPRTSPPRTQMWCIFLRSLNVDKLRGEPSVPATTHCCDANRNATCMCQNQ